LRKILNNQRCPRKRGGMNVTRRSALPFGIALLDLCRFSIFNLIGLIRVAGLFERINV
jgi:hypothetical protein